jgi:hypothetical protein
MNRNQKAARELRRQAWHAAASKFSYKIGKLQCWGADSKLQDAMGCHPAPGDSLESLQQCLRYFWLAGKKDLDGELRTELHDLRTELIGEPVAALGWWDTDSFWHRDDREIQKTLAALDMLILANKRWERDAPAEFRAAMARQEQAEVRP